ncbi:MAG: hypothetical protein ACT6FE_08015 [Methanosarcinaceae archaeon]
MIHFKKLLLASLLFNPIISCAYPKINIDQELKKIDNPWDTMGTIFYDEYLYLFDEYSDSSLLALSALGLSGITGSITGILTGLTVTLIPVRITERTEPKYVLGGCISGVLAGLAAGTLTFFAAVKLCSNYFQKKRNKRNIKTLEHLIQLWKNNQNLIPNEMNIICENLYEKYKANPEQTLQENSYISKELHQKVIRKSDYYRMKFQQKQHEQEMRKLRATIMFSNYSNR